MSESGTVKGLSPRVMERLAAKERAIEEQTVGALRQQSENFQAAVTRGQTTIESDMAALIATVRRWGARLWVWMLVGSLAVALCLGLALVLGLWGIGIVWGWEIESLRAERDEIMASVADQTVYLRAVEQKSGGIGYVVEEPPHLRLPPGSVPKKLNREEWIVLLPKR